MAVKTQFEANHFLNLFKVMARKTLIFGLC